MFRLVLRTISKSTIPSSRCVSSRLSPVISSNLNSGIFRRTYASQSKDDQIVAEFVQKLQQHPSVTQAIMKFQSLLMDKGIDASNGELSPMQYLTLLKDGDLRTAMKNVSDELQKADIKFSADQIGSLMKVLGLEK